jgi:chorismate synthase
VPVAEAVVACVLADHFLRHRGQVGESADWPFVDSRYELEGTQDP